MRKLILATFVAILVPTVSAVAADNSEPAEQRDSKIEGTSGHHKLELVTSGDAIEVFVMHDDGEPEETKDTKATATILAGGKKEEIALSPDGANSLKGTPASKLGPGTVIVITLTLPGHKPEQARFTLD